MFQHRADARLSTCNTVREHLSAAIDGEVRGALPAAMARHLRKCADCRTFEQRATTMTRHLRISVLEPVPDLTGQILERVAALTPVSTEVRVAPRARVPFAPLLARWAMAVVPLGLAVSSLASGAFAKPHIVPSHPVTRCTVALVHQHGPPRLP